jgi:hypothetical protein
MGETMAKATHKSRSKQNAPQIHQAETNEREPVVLVAEGLEIGSARNKQRRGMQRNRIIPVLKKLYPPRGVVPDAISTTTVRYAICKELGEPHPDWHSVNRALGREKK